MVVDCGCDVITGGLHVPLTVTVAVALLTLPQALNTRTQYETVAVGRAVSDGPVPSLIGVAVLPDVPTYHWYDSAVPVAVTLNVVDDPAAIVVDCGCDVIDGGVHDVVTVTVAVALLALPQALNTRTQYETVAVGRAVNDGPVPSLIGVAVLPDVPTYH